LLFYYLRALIQTPWELYLNARARRPHPSLASQHHDVPGQDQVDEPESVRHMRAAALSELRFAELIYLSLCLATPLIGTMLLRYVSTLLSTDGTISWFSSGLFVLAAGVRPWRHFINLLTSRTVDLHDIIHAPPLGPLTTSSVAQERLENLERSLAELAEGVKGMKQRLSGNGKELKAVQALVEESVEHVEGQVRNVVRAGEVGRLESDSRLDEMQRKISSLQHQLQSATNLRPSFKSFDTDHGNGKPDIRAGTLTPTTPDPLTSYVLNNLSSRRRNVLTDKIPFFSSASSSSHTTNIKTAIVAWVVHLVLWPIRLCQSFLRTLLRILGLAATGADVYGTPEVRGGIVVGRKKRGGVVGGGER